MKTGDIVWFWDKKLNIPAFAVVTRVDKSFFDFLYSSKIWRKISFSFFDNSIFLNFSDLLISKLNQKEIDVDTYNRWERCRQHIYSANYFENLDYDEAYKTISRYSSSGRSSLAYGGWITNCWRCKRHLDNERRCLSCGWMVCPSCGSCSPYCTHEVKEQQNKSHSDENNPERPSLREMDLSPTDVEPFSWGYFFDPDYDSKDYDNYGLTADFQFGDNN